MNGYGGGSCEFGEKGHELCWQYPLETTTSEGTPARKHVDGKYSSRDCAGGVGKCTVEHGVTYIYYYVGSQWTAGSGKTHCTSPYTWGSGSGGTWSERH